MTWTWNELKSKVFNALPFKKTLKEVAEENLKSALKQDYEVKLSEEIDLEELKKQIYLSPWSVTGYKHTCKIQESKNGEKTLLVHYKVISKEKARMIESAIDDYLSKIKM